MRSLVLLSVAMTALLGGVAGSESFAVLEADPLIESVHQSANDSELILLQTQASHKAQRVQNYCEICIRMIQMKQRFQPDVCSGLTDNFFITVSVSKPCSVGRGLRPVTASQCVKNLESVIKADRAVSYWHNVGCVHLDASGPEAVKPCPAHVICGWVPNIFGQRVRPDGETMGQLAPLCPRDTNFVPRVPRTDAPAELPYDFSKLSGKAFP
jgi:hypothetical protein